MKRKLKIIFFLIVMASIGGAFGYAVGSGEAFLNESRAFKMGYLYPFDVLHYILAIFSIYYLIKLLAGINRFRRASRIPEQESGYSEAERMNAALIIDSTLFASIAILWMISGMTISFSGVAETNTQQYWADALFIIGVIVVIIAAIIQIRVLKSYNKLFPKRNFDYFSMNTQKELTAYVDKLDEAEKAVAYRAGFVAFRKSYIANMNALIGMAIYSIVFQPQFFAIFVIGGILFYAQYVYFVEAKKHTLN